MIHLFLRLLLLANIPLLLWGCGEDVDPTPSKPHVLLVSFDTTRADALGCYGGPDKTSPTIDRLAKEGVRFERAIAPVPLTLPSHATMLTGLLPTLHGVRDNGLYALDPAISTLGGSLKQAGYKTGAFVASIVLDTTYGLSRDFDVYRDNVNTNASGSSLVEERPAASVINDCVPWIEERLEQDPTSPFFAFVHFYDPHFPYAPPSHWKRRFPDNPYYDEIAYADSQLDRLLRALETKGVLDNTLVIVVADHGESLGEHGEDTHGYGLYQSTQRVPFVLRHPSLPQGKVVEGLVGLIDIFPTIVDFLNLPFPEELDGKSLLEILEQEPEPRWIPGYVESETPRLAFGFSPLSGITDGVHSFLNYPRPELYHLSDDPNETRNLADSHPDIVEDFQSKIAQLRERVAYPSSLIPSSDTAKTLGILGYVVGASDAKITKTDFEFQEILDVVNLRNDGKTALAQGRVPEAIKQFKTMLQRVPDSYMAHEMLGTAYATARNTDAAMKHLESAIKLQWALPESHFNLAFCYFQKKELEKAKVHLEATLQLNPDHGQANLRLGSLLLQRGEKDRAKALLKTTLEKAQNPAFRQEAQALLNRIGG